MALPNGTTFAQFLESALTDNELSGADWRVYMHASAWIVRTGVFRESNPTTAKALGLARGTVNKALKKLVERRYLVEDGKVKRAVCYRCPALCNQGDDTTGDEVSPSDDTTGDEVSPSDDTTGDEVSPRGLQNPVIEAVTQIETDEGNSPLPSHSGGKGESGPGAGRAGNRPPAVPPCGGTSGVGPGRADTSSLSPCTPSPVAGEGGPEPSRAGSTTLERLAARQAGGGGKKSGAITRARSRLEQEIGTAAAKSWLRPLAITWRADVFSIAAPTKFMRDYVESRYGPRLRSLIGDELGRPVQVQFSAQPQEAANVAVPAG